MWGSQVSGLHGDAIYKTWKTGKKIVCGGTSPLLDMVNLKFQWDFQVKLYGYQMQDVEIYCSKMDIF